MITTIDQSIPYVAKQRFRDNTVSFKTLPAFHKSNSSVITFRTVSCFAV